MTKNNVLLLITAVVLAIIYFTSKGNKESTSQSTANFKEFSIFDQTTTSIKKIKITESKNSISLLEKEGKWSVEEKYQYPADTNKILHLINSLQELKITGEYTQKVDKHGDFQLEDPSDSSKTNTGIKIELFSNDDKLINGIILGKTKSSSAPGAKPWEVSESMFVRKLDSNIVYLANKSIEENSAPSNWLVKDVLDIKKKGVREIQILKKEKPPLVIQRDEPAAGLKISDLPEKHKQKDHLIESIAKAAEGLKMETILNAEDSKNITFVHEFILRDFDGLTFSFQLSEPLSDHNNQYAIRVKAMPDEDYIGKKQDSDKEKGIARLTLDQGKAISNEFNQTHQSWTYLVANWVATKMLKEITEISEEIKEEKPNEDAAAVHLEEGKINCSHILISYQGAERSSQTRTKEEAKTRAEDVLKKCKEENADFAALAKEFSDGPSGPNGGNLGPFGKGVMTKAFEEAAFALEVGGVSSIVETEFGYHIIKRLQ